jgi:hypothetical protein
VRVRAAAGELRLETPESSSYTVSIREPRLHRGPVRGFIRSSFLGSTGRAKGTSVLSTSAAGTQSRARRSQCRRWHERSVRGGRVAGTGLRASAGPCCYPCRPAGGGRSQRAPSRCATPRRCRDQRGCLGRPYKRRGRRNPTTSPCKYLWLRGWQPAEFGVFLDGRII